MIAESKGSVLQVQGFSVNDGEGIRTVIFLSGCPLRCQWCANPETWTLPPKLAIYRSSCTGCGLCKTACPRGLFPADKTAFDRQQCTACGKCADACPSHALKVLISEQTASEVVQKVSRDAIFFQRSGGGVTFSGGEATVQEDFLRTLATAFDARCIDLWIETCGFFEWERVQDIFSLFSNVLFDIKCMDSELHRQYTGQDNKKILENCLRIYKAGIPLTIRVPVIPGVSGTRENMAATADFMQTQLQGARVELLPYHDLGTQKYPALGMSASLHPFATPSAEEMAAFEDIFRARGITVVRFV